MKRLILALLLTCSPCFAALSSSIVWEVRSAGNANNGGGFKTGASGTDYSQQNSPQYALTGVTTAGADAVLLSASAAADMVGNVARIVSGTNFTVGYYEIISVVAGVSITLDRTCTTGAGSSGVVNVGGATNTIGALGSATAGLGAVAGNVIWVKADGAYSLGATDTINVVGTSTNPLWIKGYKTTRGDGYQGRNTTTDGKLITANMPAYAYQASYRFNISSGAFVIVETINFSGAYSGYLAGGAVDCVFKSIVSSNNSTNSSAGAISADTRGTVYDCDAILLGTTGGDAVVVVSSSGARAIGNFVQSAKTSGTSVGIRAGASGVAVVANTVLGAGAASGISVDSGATSLVLSNTVIGFTKGVSYASGLTAMQVLANNMLTDCGTAAIDYGATSVPVFQAYNRLRDVPTVSNAGTIPANSGYGNVTTDGAAYSDYVSYDGSTNLDVRLASASPARGAASPSAASMGSRQLTATGGQKSFSQ